MFARTPTSRPSSASPLLFEVTADDPYRRSPAHEAGVNTPCGFSDRRSRDGTEKLEVPRESRVPPLPFKMQLVLLFLQLLFDHPAEETKAP